MPDPGEKGVWFLSPLPWDADGSDHYLLGTGGGVLFGDGRVTNLDRDVFPHNGEPAAVVQQAIDLGGREPFLALLRELAAS